MLEPPLSLDEGRLITVLVFRVWSATKLAIESINGRSGRIGVSSNEDHVPQIRRAMQLRSISEWRACLGQVLISRQERAFKVVVGDRFEHVLVRFEHVLVGVKCPHCHQGMTTQERPNIRAY